MHRKDNFEDTKSFLFHIDIYLEPPKTFDDFFSAHGYSNYFQPISAHFEKNSLVRLLACLTGTKQER